MVEVGIAHMLILCAAQSLLSLTIETEQIQMNPIMFKNVLKIL